MRKKRIMVIRPERDVVKQPLSIPSTIMTGPLRRTQDTIYGRETIDVPSAYIENAWMYKHMIALAQDAWCILLLLDQSRTAEVYSHGFARAFHCPVIGVISKCDLMPENREICERQLEKTGVRQPYFAVSVPGGTGVEELKRYLLELKERKGLT